MQYYEFIFYENTSFYSYYVNHANDNETHKGWGNFELLKERKIRLYTSHGFGGQADDKTYDYQFLNEDTHVILNNNEISPFTMIKVT